MAFQVLVYSVAKRGLVRIISIGIMVLGALELGPNVPRGDRRDAFGLGSTAQWVVHVKDLRGGGKKQLTGHLKFLALRCATVLNIFLFLKIALFA